MHRFCVSAGFLDAGEVSLPRDIAHQVTRVLRMRPGDEIVLFDGQGGETVARLAEFGAGAVTATVIERRPGTSEPACDVVLYLSLLNKPDKFEWALQKCTEMGAAGFVPLRCSHTVSEAPEQTRHERWERIIREAAEQSGRTRVPFLQQAESFPGIIERIAQERLDGSTRQKVAIMAVPGAESSVRDALQRPGPSAGVALLVGPEGGFTEEEVSLAEESGVEPVQLGHRILRSETAAVATLAIVMYEFGEMGS